MNRIYEALLKFFGKTPLGQLAGATLVGAVLALSGLSRNPQKTIGEDIGFWLLVGAAIGFSAGVVLLIPRLVLGAVGAFVAVLGAFILLAPMHFASGRPVTALHLAVKTAVGAGLTVGGLILVVRMLRKRPPKSEDGNDGTPD